MNASDIDVMVTGGTGLIGRWLLAELTRTRNVAAVVRRAKDRTAELREFVSAHGGDARRLTVVDGDVETPGLGLTESFDAVRDVFHVAARFAFRLDPTEARRANVDGSLNVAEWARSRRSIRRFVYLGGYRMMAPSSPLRGHSWPLSDSERAHLYLHHGAYEASKHESYLAIRDFAARHALPWTGVHPSSVIGDARTGETTQTTGFGDLVARLWNGQLPALVGSKRTFLPLVTVDYLARFLATVPDRNETEGEDLCVLDPSTPDLPELVRAVAHRLGVAAPGRILPPRLVRALPRALTGVEPESLGFLSEERYDVTTAEAHASAVGLARPPIDESVERWTDFLVSTRFGDEPHADRGSFRGGVFSVGDPRTADVLYLHGLPWNGDAWKSVADRVGAPHARVDLPGLGRSAPMKVDDGTWLDRLLEKRSKPIVLVGHSLGAAMAVRYAHDNPARVAGLVLVSPAFLQRRAGFFLRIPAAVSLSLRRAKPAALAARLVPELTAAAHPAVVSACFDLRQRGVSARVAKALTKASREKIRQTLREQLESLRVPVTIIHGDQDPILFSTRHPVHTIERAGHNPHISRPEAVAALIEATPQLAGRVSLAAMREPFASITRVFRP